MIVAIHQPNFVPWLGYFNKVASCDTFVVLDHVAGFYRSSWLTRNRILRAGEPGWLTVPVHRSDHAALAITDVRVQWENRLVAQNLQALRAHYGAHPHFDEVFELVQDAHAAQPELLAELNLSLNSEIWRRLGLAPRVVRSSQLADAQPGLRELRGSELLVAICRVLGADGYLSGDGSAGYLEPAAFARAGVSLTFQGFSAATYPQRGAGRFTSHLSILDPLFNLGFGAVADLVHQPSTGG